MNGRGVNWSSGVVVGFTGRVEVGKVTETGGVDVGKGAGLGTNVDPRHAGVESTRTAGWSVLPN